VEVIDNNKFKTVISDNYNYSFNKIEGTFYRWGSTMDEDPDCAPSPELIDIEISTICNRQCAFCYKSNGPVGVYMHFEKFKEIFDKLPSTICQVALGIGDVSGNPDLYKIMKYCRDNGVIPNITINGSRMTEHDYEMLSGLCGAVAVSLYDYDTCKNAIVELGKHGLHQVNIHCLLSEETFDKCMDIAQKAHSDPLLARYLNAVVFLWLKPKGVKNSLHAVTEAHYKKLMACLKKNQVRFGFDSCSAPKVMALMPKQAERIEPCESTLFSLYINVEGKVYPCSFSENENGYNGIDVAAAGDFVTDVWNSDQFTRFRAAVIGNKDKNGCRNCPLFNLDFGCKND
jgi:radical SAM protein with 4Fe4S-binding SPASM domain